MTYGWLDARIWHGLQALDEFNDVMPKEIAPIFIDFRHSRLHCLVATDAAFLSDELDCFVDDVEFVHLCVSFGYTFATHLIVPFSWDLSSLAITPNHKEQANKAEEQEQRNEIDAYRVT